MRLNEPIYRALNSEQKIRILRFLLSGGPIPDMSERELARMVKISNAGVNRAMSSFEELNLVHYRRIGHSHVWSVNEDSHAYGVLKKVIQAMKENRAPIDELKRDMVKELKKLPVIKAALFGSVARGGEKPNSDVDLFVLVKDAKDKKTVETALEGLGTKVLKVYGNTLGFYILTESEYRKRKGLGVIKNIEKEGQKLI